MFLHFSRSQERAEKEQDVLRWPILRGCACGVWQKAMRACWLLLHLDVSAR